MRTAALIAVVIPMLATSPSSAAEATLRLESVGAAPGSTVRMRLSLSTDDLVGAFNMTVHADGLVVADVDYTGPLFSSGWTGWDTAPSDAAFLSAACIFPQDQVIGDLPLLDLLVDVPAGAAPGSTIDVTLSDVLVTNYVFTPYTVVIIPGTIEVTTATCAEDLDGSGTVDFSDLLRLFGAWGSCDRACAEDIDGDGVVGATDLLRLLAAWGACAG
ncbi:MAG: hypothetical protein KF817_15130 [Phycisphaeraceae bacterium]|nr:hypothetical protein [Phycisphaeraceae bacterium]